MTHDRPLSSLDLKSIDPFIHLCSSGVQPLLRCFENYFSDEPAGFKVARFLVNSIFLSSLSMTCNELPIGPSHSGGEPGIVSAVVANFEIRNRINRFSIENENTMLLFLSIFPSKSVTMLSSDS